MVKKLIQILLIVNIILSIFVKKTYAFGIKYNPNSWIIGTCGIPNSSNNKCCRLPSMKIDLHTGVKELDIPLTPLRWWIEIQWNFLFSTLPKKGDEIISRFKVPGYLCRYDSIPSTWDLNDPNCICVPAGSSTLASTTLCDLISSAKEKKSCVDCFQAPKPGVWTAIGCISSDFNLFIENTLLKLGVGFAGIIALFCIIYATIQMQTSQGSPEKIKRAQELLTSCIMGLMLIIFSVFILRLIGVDILRIPGWAK